LELKERAMSTAKLSDHHLYDPEYRYIMETLNLPLYLAHLSGEFVFANTPFLQQFGFTYLKELNQYRHQLFCTSERAIETKELVERGSVNGYQISVNLPSGQRMTVRDYATLKNAHILGIIFDVSDYVNLNSEMKEALEIQELLNDKIMSSALILQKTQTTSIRALARLAEYRDQETGHHLQRICQYTEVLVKEVLRTQPFPFKITEQYVHDMVLSSMLHDVGKVAVPDNILRKKNNLSAEEWEIMKKHTMWGWQILSQADKELGEQSFLTLASQIAISHHERWDGSGYPQGLKR
jgi:response regulator RpfG family c-di-GMP phosphodiesterase